jgi:DNA-binding MarR family transcriptional regulator
MNDKLTDQESFRTFQLMSELENESPISQRELASRLGIAVGLVNSCLKNFVAKGYVRVKNYPRNRYAYLLTPTGLAEKSRLAYQHLSYFAGLYTTTRRDYLELFIDMDRSGIKEVAFAGIDEVAEIAFLSLQEVGVKLVGVYDNVRVGENFLGYTIQSIDTVDGEIIITSLKRRVEILEELAGLEIPAFTIHLPKEKSFKG